MLILRRHWVAGGKCDVTLTPALVDIVKNTSGQSTSTFTITTRQSGTIIAKPLTNINNVPYFTIDKSSFSPGTTTVTVTGIAFEEGYPTIMGSIEIKCNGGGKQFVDVDYVDGPPCSLELSIDNLYFNPNNRTIRFNVISSERGTIDITNIAKTTTTEHRSGTREIDLTSECSGSLTIDSVTENAGGLSWNYLGTWTFTNNSDKEVQIATVSATLHSRKSSTTPSDTSCDFVHVGAGQTVTREFYMNGAYDDFEVIGSGVESSSGSESYEYDATIVTPHVSFAPTSFPAGTTEITATLSNLAQVGSLGYAIFRNECGSVLNLNVAYRGNVLSINPSSIILDSDGTAQTVTITSSTVGGTITADSDINVNANSFNSGSTTIQVSAAPNSDTNSKNLGVITVTDTEGNIVTCTVTQAAASVTPAQYPEGEELIGAGFYDADSTSDNPFGAIPYDYSGKENVANLRLDYQVGFTYLGDERPVRELRLNASAKPNTLTLSLYITDSNTATGGYDGSAADITALGTKLAEVPLTFISGEYHSTPVNNLLTPVSGATNANTQQVTMDQQGDISLGTWTTLFSFTMPAAVLNALTSGNAIVGVVDNHRTVSGMITYNNPDSIGGAVGGIFSYDIID